MHTHNAHTMHTHTMHKHTHTHRRPHACVCASFSPMQCCEHHAPLVPAKLAAGISDIYRFQVCAYAVYVRMQCMRVYSVCAYAVYVRMQCAPGVTSIPLLDDTCQEAPSFAGMGFFCFLLHAKCAVSVLGVSNVCFYAKCAPRGSRCASLLFSGCHVRYCARGVVCADSGVGGSCVCADYSFWGVICVCADSSFGGAVGCCMQQYRMASANVWCLLFIGSYLLLPVLPSAGRPWCHEFHANGSEQCVLQAMI